MRSQTGIPKTGRSLRDRRGALGEHALPIALCMLLSALPAYAHKLKIFATGSTHGVISGYVYFSRDSRPSGLPVTCSGGGRMLRTESGEKGRFKFTVTEPSDYTLTTESADGHRGAWTVSARELGFGPPSPEPESAASDRANIATAHPLEAQVAALREKLEARETRLRFRDILGGLGWILALTLLAVNILRKRKDAC